MNHHGGRPRFRDDKHTTSFYFYKRILFNRDETCKIVLACERENSVPSCMFMFLCRLRKLVESLDPTISSDSLLGAFLFTVLWSVQTILQKHWVR